MNLDFGNQNSDQDDDFFIIIKDHRKMAKSRRRKLLRKFKKDLLQARQTVNLRKRRTRRDVEALREDNLWDVLDSNFLSPHSSAMDSSLSNMNFMSSLKVEDFSTEQVGQSAKTSLFSPNFVPFLYEQS